MYEHLESVTQMSEYRTTPWAASFRVFFLIGMLVNSVMLLAAARGDLWFDEIWSISFAESARTPWDIVSVFKHDNNHVLNTFFLYAIGRHDNLMVYRTLAIASGIASLALLVVIARKWGSREGILALVFAGTSYPLILYFSEARGYAPAIFFSLASCYLLQEGLSRFSRWRMVLFWLAAILGTLSHFSFVIVFLSLVIFIFAREIAARSSFRDTLLQLSRYALVPFVFIGAFYLYFTRDMVIGGGDKSTITAEIMRGAVSLLGMPDGLMATKLPLIVLLLLVSAAVYFFYRDRDIAWSFYLSVLLLLPSAVILVARPVYFNFRYVILCFPFFYLMLSFLFGRLYRSSGKYRHILTVLVCLFVIGQTQRLVPLFQLGRGSYRPILAEMVRRSRGDVISIGSDHDFRNGLLLSFYSRFLPPRKSIRYIEQPLWGMEMPEWIIKHSTAPSYEPPPFLVVSNENIYELTKEEKFAGNSGFGWFLYHHRTNGQ